MTETETQNKPPALPAERSPEINLIAAALSKAQGEIGTAARNARNDFIGNTFADLTSVVEAIREPLAANGLALSQTFLTTAEGTVLATWLLHESGQYLRGFLPLLNVTDWHSLGSAITYARRYSINALLNVAPEGADDDGEAAMERAPKPKRTRKPAPRKPAATKPATKPEPKKDPPANGLDKCAEIIAECPGADDYLRGIGVDPGDPPANIREKILGLGAKGLEKAIEEQRKKERAAEIIAEADTVEALDDEPAPLHPDDKKEIEERIEKASTSDDKKGGAK